MIGVVLLVGVTVLAVAVVAALFLSGPQPDEIPHATIVAGNESGRLVLAHDGGDPLREGEYRVYIDLGDGLVDETGNFTGSEDGVWSIGGTLVYNGTERPERVVVTAASGSGETILAEPAFVSGGAGFSPDPVEPGVTEIPPPTPEEIIVSPDMMTDIGWQEDFDFAAKIERDDIVRVDLIIYNYDDSREGQGKITSAQAYEMTKNTALDFYYNRTIKIAGNIGKANEHVSITIIAYNKTGITASQSVLATIQEKQKE